MEILIATILIIIYLIYQDFSHQKQEMRILNLLIQGKENKSEVPSILTLNPFKKIMEKIENENKNIKESDKLKEQEEKYSPLEDVPDEEVQKAFEGTKKVDKEEIEE